MTKNNNRPTKRKPAGMRGQVTVFIILALITLFVITSLIILSIWQAQSQTSQPIQRAGSFDSVIGDITNYVEACLAKEAAPLVVALAEHGGRMEPPEEIYLNGTKIHALCINRNNFEGCVSTLTTKSSLEQELKTAMMASLSECTTLQPQFGSTGAKITTGNPSLNVSITIDSIHLILAYPVKVTLGPNQRELDTFSTSLETPLGRLFGMALDITNQAARGGIFDKEEYMANHDSSILIETHKPYPHIVYQLRRYDPRQGQDFLFQFALQGKKTAGSEPLYLDPKYSCCYANDNTYHYNPNPTECDRIGKYEGPGCGMPANAAPIVEGCCVLSANQCSVTTSKECGQGNTFYENDRLCSQAPGCTSLDCHQTYNMPTRTVTFGPRKNGESWCIYDGRVGNGNDLVGSRHYLHSCVRGREYVEPCRDFREELCAEERRSTPGGAVIAHATCRINRFADCTRQQDAGNCLDTNVRDCEWMPGVYGSTPTYTRYALCIPTVAPGLPFWDGTGQGICKEANNENTAAPKKKRTFGHQACWACQRVGDCGPKQNIADVLTLGGYFNPDGVVDASKLLPAGSTRQQYPGLAIATRATKISPVVIARPDLLVNPSSAGSDATCSLWQTPGGGDCTLCDSNPYWQPCTEYRCKNIGANCQWSELAGIGTCSGPSTEGATKPKITVVKQGGPNVKPHEPWPIELSIDQNARCAIRVVSRRYSGFASATWGVCLPQIMPPNLYSMVPAMYRSLLDTVCINPPTIHLSDGKFETSHKTEIRFPTLHNLLNNVYTFMDENGLTAHKGVIQTYLRNGFKLYLTCTSERGIVSDQVEFPIDIQPGGGNAPPKIIEIHPKQHELPEPDGSPRPITLFVDRPFKECSVKPQGLTEIKLSCPGTTEPDQKFGIYMPPGSYECAGSQLTLNSPKFTFTCKDETGQGVPFHYEPNKPEPTTT